MKSKQNLNYRHSILFPDYIHVVEAETWLRQFYGLVALRLGIHSRKGGRYEIRFYTECRLPDQDLAAIERLMAEEYKLNRETIQI